MSIYTSAVEAHRETTKWLTAFLPVTGIVGAAAVIGPRLMKDARSSAGVGQWAAQHSFLLGLLLLYLAAIGAIMWAGSAVLSREPSDISDLSNEPLRNTVSEAIGHGMLAPEFLTIEDFEGTRARLANAWDTKQAPDTADLERTRQAYESLREWSLLHNLRGPLLLFRCVFVLAAAIMLGVTAYVPFALSSSPDVGEPTAVMVTVAPAAEQALEETTGCTDATHSTFLAVGGTWEQPVLAVDGEGCRFGATWRPRPDQAELRLP